VDEVKPRGAASRARLNRLSASTQVVSHEVGPSRGPSGTSAGAFAEQYARIYERRRYGDGIWGHDIGDLWIEGLEYYPKEQLIYAGSGREVSAWRIDTGAPLPLHASARTLTAGDANREPAPRTPPGPGRAVTRWSRFRGWDFLHLRSTFSYP